MTKAAFCIADSKFLKYYEMMKNSLRKFHSEEELPLILIDEAKINSYRDPDFFYRATPIIASELIEKYDLVIKIDADTIITGDLSELWKGAFDVGVVNNSNPREMKAYPVSVWNIHPLAYVNCGLVVMKNKRFIEHWKKLCYSDKFPLYQMREQDLLNIMVQYGDYEVKRFDEGDSYYGLASKGYWTNIELQESELILPAQDNWPPEGEKKIKAIHWAGGSSADKMNFRIRFKPEVVKRLEWLTI